MNFWTGEGARLRLKNQLRQKLSLLNYLSLEDLYTQKIFQPQETSLKFIKLTITYSERSNILENNLTLRSPLAPNIPFIGESTTQKTHQTFKVSPLENIKPKEV